MVKHTFHTITLSLSILKFKSLDDLRLYYLRCINHVRPNYSSTIFYFIDCIVLSMITLILSLKWHNLFYYILVGGAKREACTAHLLNQLLYLIVENVKSKLFYQYAYTAKLVTTFFNTYIQIVFNYLVTATSRHNVFI